MNTATIITTPNLVFLNDEAIRTDRNRALVADIGDRLDPEGLHLVTFVHLHNDVEARLVLLMKMRDSDVPVEGVVDIPLRGLDALVRIRRTADGTGWTWADNPTPGWDGETD